MKHKDLDKNLYFYILSFFTIQDLGRLAQTDKHNKDLSQHDIIWRDLFLRDYHTCTFYTKHNCIIITEEFKKAYKKSLPLLPLMQSDSLGELARQMQLLSYVFPKMQYSNRVQIRRVWYGISEAGESITRQYGVRNTYLRIKSEFGSDREDSQRGAKKARMALNTSKEHALTLDTEDTVLIEQIYKK